MSTQEELTPGRIGLWTFSFEGQPVERIRDAATEIDELGFGTVWFGEAGGREAFTQSAVLLGASERITVATGIAQIGVRTPAAMAAAQHTLAQAYPGRFLLGIGGTISSDQQPVSGLIPEPGKPRPVAGVRDYLAALDTAAEAAAQRIPVARQPRRVLAALGPGMLRLAAERAWGAHSYFVPPAHTASARETMGPDSFLAVEQAVVLESDQDTARKLAREHVGGYLAIAAHHRHNLTRLGYTATDLADGGSDRLVDAMVAGAGAADPLAAIGERIDEHLAAGANHVCLQVLTADQGRIPLAEWRELAQLLG